MTPIGVDLVLRSWNSALTLLWFIGRPAIVAIIQAVERYSAQ
jgi:energy-converting hydrogenase Eha subunit E